MSFTVIILAAGKGSRMESSVSKPLHKIAGSEMIQWVLEAAKYSGAEYIIPVIRENMSDLASFLSDYSVAIQKNADGTAGAVMAALPYIKNFDQPIIVLFADTPFITKDIIRSLYQKICSGNDICVLGFSADDPYGYGRLVQSNKGKLLSIVEESEASKSEKMIKNVNAGIMAFNGNILEATLTKIKPTNSKQEYFLTDAVSIGSENNLNVGFILTNQKYVIGVNNRNQLAEAEILAQKTLRENAMNAGVTMIAPETIFLQRDTKFGQDVTIEPNVIFGSNVSLAKKCYVKSFCYLEECSLGEGNIIGPFARIRPNTITNKNVKIGNFVEVKKSNINQGTKINHLSYIGDTVIGENVNIGAGTITCNFDGYKKYKTNIGSSTFIGSNTSLIAPLNIGDNSVVGAGSVITEDTPADSLSLSRAKQETKIDGGKKFRKNK